MRFAPYLLVAVCACATAVQPTAPFAPRIFKGALLPGAAAQTRCDITTNEPYIVIDTSYLGKPEQNYLMAHEMRHVEQMQGYKGGCREFQKRYSRDLMFKLNAELEASCVQLAVAVKDGASYENGITAIVRYYYTAKDYPRVSYEFLEIRTRGYCRGAR